LGLEPLHFGNYSLVDYKSAATITEAVAAAADGISSKCDALAVKILRRMQTCIANTLVSVTLEKTAMCRLTYVNTVYLLTLLRRLRKRYGFYIAVAAMRLPSKDASEMRLKLPS